MKDINFLLNNGVDIQKSLELFGDIETYNLTLEDYLLATYEKLPKIKQYKETADMANYAILVHSIKSDARYFGFTKLAELAYEHELKSKANDSTYVFENFNSLMTEANRMTQIVKIYLGKENAPQINVNPNPNPDPSTPKDKTILVVDDSNIVLSFIKKVFNNEYQVILAMDGKEALNAIAADPNHKISCMLLDLNMPNINGFEVLDYFKNNNLFSKIPVSIITGEDSKEIINKAFTYNIVDVLTKPFNERDVKRIVEKTIIMGK